MNNNKGSKKDIILKASYKLLLHRCFKDVTFSDIEAETQLTRGAIYYYFTNKKHLFEEVIQFYYFQHFYNYNLSSLISDDFTIETFKYSYKSPFERIMNNIAELSNQFNILNPARSFLHVTIQASDIYPKFDEEVKILLDKEYETIKSLILLSSGSKYKIDELCDMLNETYDTNYIKIFKAAFLH